MNSNFIFCFLFIFSNIDHGLSTTSLVDIMNSLFKQDSWARYPAYPKEINEGLPILVESEDKESENESRIQFVNEENVNEKVRVGYMLVHHYFSFMINDILLKFKTQLKENVKLFVVKQCFERLEKTLSKIKSSLALLASYYKGDDLPTLVQNSIKRLEVAMTEATSTIKSIKDNPKQARKFLQDTITNLRAPFIQLQLQLSEEGLINYDEKLEAKKYSKYFKDNLKFVDYKDEDLEPQWYIMSLTQLRAESNYEDLGLSMMKIQKQVAYVQI